MHTDRILSLLPRATEAMLDRFLVERSCSVVTARIWAEKGVLMVLGDSICKRPTPGISPDEIQSIKKQLETLCQKPQEPTPTVPNGAPNTIAQSGGAMPMVMLYKPGWMSTMPSLPFGTTQTGNP